MTNGTASMTRWFVPCPNCGSLSKVQECGGQWLATCVPCMEAGDPDKRFWIFDVTWDYEGE